MMRLHTADQGGQRALSLKGRRVAVVGMARSGIAAVELLLQKGARVTAVDQKPIAGLGFEVVAQTEAAFEDAGLIVLSPGVPADVEVLGASRARGAEVIGDLELASWFLHGPIAGITGSNGKTTTTALTGHIFAASGIPAQVGGNIGTPPCSLVASSRPDQWNILELSSFQLETTKTFHAHVAAALNVTPDHLDRHYTFDRYASAKGRLFANQRAEDFAVLNAEDPIVRSYAALTPARDVWFNAGVESPTGARLEKGEIILAGERLMAASEVPLRGRHNAENTMAAALIAHIAGARHEQIRSGVMTFPGVEHRLEFVREIQGVRWYNDSKATNVDATLKALAAFEAGLWVMLGGKDKNSDYAPLARPLQDKARGVLLIGAAAPKIEAQLRGQVPLLPCGDLARAVAEAHRRASPGETVLLAPACASFDQFENFEHRGREFKRFVNSLPGGG
jgi:UDP-N-acetylmuramoylalanine--D-glutamate ligase